MKLLLGQTVEGPAKGQRADDIEGRPVEPGDEVDGFVLVGLALELLDEKIHMAHDHVLLLSHGPLGEAPAQQLPVPAMGHAVCAQDAVDAIRRRDHLQRALGELVVADAVGPGVGPDGALAEGQLVGGDAHHLAVLLVQGQRVVHERACEHAADGGQLRDAVCFGAWIVAERVQIEVVEDIVADFDGDLSMLVRFAVFRW